MARVTAAAGRTPPPAGRREAVLRALTAAGVGVLPTYETTHGTDAGRVFQQATVDGAFPEMSGAGWPCDMDCLVEGVQGLVFRDDAEAVYRLPNGCVAYVSLSWGTCRLKVAGPSATAVQQAAGTFAALYPATYLSAVQGERVPITFWSHGPHGPVQRLRMIDASPWSTIEGNYTETVREQLAKMMDGFQPGKGGQLILWQGEPGTGKTWALRALVSEWLPWAEFHYITDPDAFFVDYPSYMVDVLLADSYGAIDPGSGDYFEEEAADGKWRVLILEDTGELLSANAKEKYGQGLSRLLNVVDGMIGQGLKVLCLVTTNDELGELNAAVRRPGRCAAQIEFFPMTAAEAADWLGEDVNDSVSLAELYSRVPEERDPSFTDEPDDGRDLTAAGTPADEPDEPGEVASVIEEIGEVAEQVAPQGGYGDTYWNAGTGTVYWVSADWTTAEELDAAHAAFAAIDGVSAVEGDAETAGPSGDGWVQVWPEPDSEAALSRIISLAARPLDLKETG